MGVNIQGRPRSRAASRGVVDYMDPRAHTPGVLKSVTVLGANAAPPSPLPTVLAAVPTGKRRIIKSVTAVNQSDPAVAYALTIGESTLDFIGGTDVPPYTAHVLDTALVLSEGEVLKWRYSGSALNLGLTVTYVDVDYPSIAAERYGATVGLANSGVATTLVAADSTRARTISCLLLNNRIVGSITYVSIAVGSSAVYRWLSVPPGVTILDSQIPVAANETVTITNQTPSTGSINASAHGYAHVTE